MTVNQSGAFVAKIQQALGLVNQATIDASEIGRSFYGKSTAQAVIDYKSGKSPPIINFAYEQAVDNIVWLYDHQGDR